MGNFLTTLKKFFQNKNTVTILGVIAGVIVLWGFYNYRVNEAINPKKVPVAKRDILAKEEITKDDIEYVEVSSKLLQKSQVVVNPSLLVGHYVNIGTSIPKGAMFYVSQVVEKKELPDAITDEIPEGYTLYQMKVDNNTTFANSIYPGNNIDLFLKTRDEATGKFMYGCFIKSIKVLAVRDSNGQNVFDSTSNRKPAFLLFSVPNKMYKLLKGTDFISGMELFPVPRNKKYTDVDGATEIDSTELETIIQSKMRPVDDSYAVEDSGSNSAE